MIDRYSLPETVSIWESENRYKIWLEIEKYACEAMVEIGVIPEEDVAIINEKAKFDSKKIDEIEKIARHDVIAFLTNVAEYVGDSARFMHLGMTSSDVLDTCFSLQLKQSGELILKKLDKLLASLKKQAMRHKDAISIGRSHGIHAEPITLGLKFARFYAEFNRNKIRLQNAIDEISVCAISGAVGTYANIDPYVEEYVAGKLGLKPETISSQIIPRDRYANFFSTFAVIASSIENVAIEIRHLQRSEVSEAEEKFHSGQKGSSAMPHKRNPVLSENLTGLARMIRSYAIPALENVALWHERDISHSSVERMIGPDACITLDFALNRMADLIENLIVYPENMKRNMEKFGGLIYSQKVMLQLVVAGLSREESYRVIQKHAMDAWKNDKDFLSLLTDDEEVTKYISQKDLADLFDISYHMKYVDKIYDKVFG